jgi:hypothetical protein
MLPLQVGARLPCHSSNCRNQLLDLVPLVGHIAGRECIRNTMGNVILEYLLLDFMQRSADRIDLRQHIHAITVVFYHPKQTANLTLDPPQALRNLGFGDIVHGDQPLILYPGGVYSAGTVRCHGE